MNSAYAKRGFTLMEMLIVVAIIAVLIAIAIPIFVNQLEKSREATDLANVRAAYAEVSVAAMENISSFQNASGDYEAQVSPLQQQIDGWTTDISDVSIGGVASAYWVGEPKAGGSCTITISSTTGEATITWGTGSRVGGAFANMSLQDLKAIDNDKRVAEDQKTLTALGKAILNQGWSLNDLKNYLGLPETSGGAVRIADYYQLKTGDFAGNYESDGFKLTYKPGDKMVELLNSIGYEGGAIKSSETTGDRTNTVFTNSLFFSDELATNNFNNNAMDKTKRSIIIQDIKQKDGKITGFTIYTKAMDNQANMNNAEKAKFSITL